MKVFRLLTLVLGLVLASCTMPGSAGDSGDIENPVLEKTVETPILNLGLTVTDTTYITIRCDTESASIFYTTNGSIPSTSGTPYNAGDKINITEDNTVIKVIAVKASMLDSMVVEECLDILVPTDLTGNTITDCDENVTNIVIPSSVTSIGDNAFQGCNSLLSVIIPDSVTSIGNGAFISCTSLTSITIPAGVTSIGYAAFATCTALTSITITDSVTSIGKDAFANCYSLTSITIPDSVTSIEDYTFFSCTSLTSITIPNSVTSIRYCAFYRCTSLTSITIPAGIIYISDRAFRESTLLSEITVKNTIPPSLGTDALTDIDTDFIIRVPVGYVDEYEAHADWTAFTGKIFEIES